MLVFDYSGSFHNLSSQEIDNILMHSNLEECTLSIDSSLCRALEINMTVKKTRAQRDLGELASKVLGEKKGERGGGGGREGGQGGMGGRRSG